MKARERESDDKANNDGHESQRGRQEPCEQSKAAQRQDQNTVARAGLVMVRPRDMRPETNERSVQKIVEVHQEAHARRSPVERRCCRTQRRKARNPVEKHDRREQRDNAYEEALPDTCSERNAFTLHAKINRAAANSEEQDGRENCAERLGVAIALGSLLDGFGSLGR